MSRSSSLFLALLAFVLVGGTARAQTGSVSIPAWIDEGHCGPTPDFEATFNGKPAQVAGYFQRAGDMNHIVMTLEGFEESAAIVYHEYTHLLVKNTSGNVPTWFNEGLAVMHQAQRDSSFPALLAAARDSQQFLSLTSLCGPFNPAQVNFDAVDNLLTWNLPAPRLGFTLRTPYFST